MAIDFQKFPFTIIPVETPLRMKYSKPLSREEIFAIAANPPPIELLDSLKEKELFSRDLRGWDFPEQIRDATYIKLPQTPVIIHQCMQQFLEPICRALHAHYGPSMEDREGEFIVLIIAQKTLKPGEYSTFGGLHIDCSFSNLFKMIARPSEQFIVSDTMPTMMTESGFDLRPIMDFVEDKTTLEERLYGPVDNDVFDRAFELARKQTEGAKIIIPEPYQMTRYSEFTLHEAQMATGICRRTVIGLQFFSVCSAAAFESYLDPQEISNGRMLDYLRNPSATLRAPNARILDLR